MKTIPSAAILVAAQLIVSVAGAQDVRKMEFVSGQGQDELAVKVQYEEPSSVPALLHGSRVLSVFFEVRNASSRALSFQYRDLRLNLGGDAPLAAADPAAAWQEIRRMKRVPALFRFLGNQSTAFHPQQLRVWLEKQQLEDGSIGPGQTKKGLVFFICPGGAPASATDGFLWLEAKGRPPQILETKDVTVWTKTPQQTGFVAKLKQTWDRYLGNTPPAFNKSYALLIGISSYKHLPRLESPTQDVKKMAEYLIAQGFDEIVTITDDHVTPDSFRQPQKYFKTKLDAADRFLFYYSGHGMSVSEAGRPRGYLPMTLEVAGGIRQSIPMDSLVTWLKSLTSQHLLVILDSCFSGLAVEGTEVKGGEFGLRDPKIDQEALNRLARGPARYLMMAGTAGQQSFGGREWNGSLFTDVLLKGLRTSADTYHNHIVTTRALYVWLKEAVYLEARKSNKELTPLFLDLGPNGVSLGEFIFVQ
jgi:hypothetical protein